MNCFYHPEVPAVGVCKYCQRGLCGECAALADDALACKRRHEDEVRRLEQLAARSLFLSKRAAAGYMRNAIFYGLVAVAFAGVGVWQYRWLGWQALLLILLGAFLLYAAVANYLEAGQHK